MKKIIETKFFLISCLLFCIFLPSAGSSKIVLLQNNEEAVILEFITENYNIKNTEINGQKFQIIEVSGTKQTIDPGTIQIPRQGTMLAIPHVDGAKIEILEENSEILNGLFRLPPVPEYTSNFEKFYTLNTELYLKNEFFPQNSAKLISTGLMRDQAVAQIMFYPVQYNPVTSQIRLFSKILLKITWDQKNSKKVQNSCDNAFDKIYKGTLLNYEPAQNCSNHQISSKSIKKESQASRIKIGLSEDGIYKITYNDITNSDLDFSENIDSASIMMTNKGDEIPIFVSKSEGNLSSEDYILFYGTGIDSGADEEDYTDENIYFLSFDGEDALRMQVEDLSATQSTQYSEANSFEKIVHLEENTYYGENTWTEFWFWGNYVNAPESRSYTFTLTDLADLSYSPTVQVKLKGRSATPHHVRLYLNDILIDDWQWDGQINTYPIITINSDLLNEGENYFRLEALYDSSINQFYVDWFKVYYQSKFVAQDNELRFKSPGDPTDGIFQFEISGFSNDNIMLFDITEINNISLLINPEIIQNGENFKLNFMDQAYLETVYLATSNFRIPERIEPDIFTDLKSQDNEASYLIISHKDYYDQAGALETYRNCTGEIAKLVLLDNVYDEFNDGIKSPSAIKAFIEYAYHNWKTKPAYVLLVGDASLDPKKILNERQKDFIPTNFINVPNWGRAANDYWFVQVNGDDELADLIIGRIPARNNNDVSVIIDKIKKYDQQYLIEGWRHKALLVADDPDSAKDTDFTQDMEMLADLLPSFMKSVKMYDYDPETSVQKEIDKGAAILSYSGHGDLKTFWKWQNQYFIFSTYHDVSPESNIEDLTNGHKLPFMTVTSCIIGNFIDYKSSSMSEEFLFKDNAGGIAAWTPSGTGYPTSNTLIHKELYKALFNTSNKKISLAEASMIAVINAKIDSPEQAVFFDHFNFLGDPASCLYFSVDEKKLEDAIVICQLIAGSTLTKAYHPIVDDINGDNVLGIEELIWVLEHLANILNEF